jgi:hypothetical protein
LLDNQKRKVKRFLEIPGIKSALSTIILIIPLVLGLWNDLKLEYKIVFVALTAGLNYGFVYYDYKKPKWKIEDMLNAMNLSLWSDKNQHFRANVMLFNSKKNTIAIKYLSTSMMGATDRKLCIGSNQGCAGEAFKTKREMVVDLTQQTHEDYHINPRDVWSEMKSVVSVPIFEDEEHTIVSGILNVDSDLEVNETKFFDTNVIRVISVYADWISELI